MSFIEKKKIYIIVILLCAKTLYAQIPLSPQILLQAEKSKNNQHLFYAFENQAITLYAISNNKSYSKIWEYKFLKKKNIELIDALYGDISGNGIKELVVILYSFESNNEIYVFKTDNNIPKQQPEIYSLPSLRKGSKILQGKLLTWDKDKDKEIILNISSPERKVAIFDYTINKIIPIEEVAKNFMLTTYGPTQFNVHDYNKDSIDEVVILNKSKEPTIFNSLMKQEEKEKTYPENLIDFIILDTGSQVHEIGLTQQGKVILLDFNKTPILPNMEVEDIIKGNNAEIILINKKKEIIIGELLADNKSINIITTQPHPLKAKQYQIW